VTDKGTWLSRAIFDASRNRRFATLGGKPPRLSLCKLGDPGVRASAIALGKAIWYSLPHECAIRIDPRDQHMKEAIIRRATEHDLPEILNLYRHLHPHEAQLEPATAERVWSNLLTLSFMSVIVAQAAEQLLSSCTLAVVPNLSRGGRSYGVIENVVTHADHRKLGLGRRVLAHALDIASQADCYKVHLATGSKREATLRFYEEAGFERGGKTYFEVRR
jgi:ribosomal protein S18 acetylase RimI-like enzyme